MRPPRLDIDQPADETVDGHQRGQRDGEDRKMAGETRPCAHGQFTEILLAYIAP